jgi:hypothetical protein
MKEKILNTPYLRGTPLKRGRNTPYMQETPLKRGREHPFEEGKGTASFSLRKNIIQGQKALLFEFQAKIFDINLILFVFLPVLSFPASQILSSTIFFYVPYFYNLVLNFRETPLLITIYNTISISL